eukprot:scaffold4308_cov152-Skeletonema_menzelii.AAC.11
MASPRHISNTTPKTTGALLLSLSVICYLAAIYILFFGGGRRNSSSAFSLWSLIPLSTIPLLIFLMIRYVALRLYLRN